MLAIIDKYEHNCHCVMTIGLTCGEFSARICMRSCLCWWCMQTSPCCLQSDAQLSCACSIWQQRQALHEQWCKLMQSQPQAARSNGNGHASHDHALRPLVGKLEENLRDEQRAYCQQHHQVFRHLLSHTQVCIASSYSLCIQQCISGMPGSRACPDLERGVW